MEISVAAGCLSGVPAGAGSFTSMSTMRKNIFSVGSNQRARASSILQFGHSSEMNVRFPPKASLVFDMTIQLFVNAFHIELWRRHVGLISAKCQITHSRLLHFLIVISFRDFPSLFRMAQTVTAESTDVPA